VDGKFAGLAGIDLSLDRFSDLISSIKPFEGSYAESMMYSIVNEKPKQLSQYLDNAPEKLKEIVKKLLQKEKEDGYKDISELLIDLQPLIRENITIEVKTQPTTLKYKPYMYIGTAILIILLLLTIGRPLLFPEIIKGNKIAVLPLANISNKGEEDYLIEGMTDALITELAQISSLSVISRNSSMQYKGTAKSPPDIASELGVHYLVDGSLLMMGQSVKISARLLNAQNNDYIWAKEYKRDFKDILGLQGEIAKAIASQIEVKLTPQEEKLLTKQRKINPETYEMYMRGMYYINKRTPNEIEKGISYLHQAAESDSTEPLAQAGLSLGYCILAHTPAMLTEFSQKSKLAARKALELDENLAEAHLAIAMNSIYFDWDRAKAANEYKRALELNPNLTLALMHYAWFQILMNKPNESHDLMNHALEVDPLSSNNHAEFGWMKIGANEFDKAIALAKESIELNPNNPFSYFVLGEGYAGKRMYKEAIEAQKRSAQLSPYWEWGLARTYAQAGYNSEALTIITKLEGQVKLWDTWCLAVVYAALRDEEKLFYWLEEAFKQRHPYIQWMKGQKYFNFYKEDPQFIELAKRMKLPD
jgi:TolB-like protein/Tfp pilus assembly protein PilF